MPTQFLFFPDEVLLDILENLDLTAVLACQATCRRLRNITTSASLQYKVELAACGMLDGMRGQQTLPTSERLDRLRQYDAAWRELRWTQSIHLPHLIGQWFTIRAGPLTLCDPDTKRPHIVQEVPSKLRGTREMHHSFPSEPEVRVEVDLSQDLVAYLDFVFGDTRYSIRSLSNGEPHPLASNLGIIQLGASRTFRSILDIWGDYILELGEFSPTKGHYTVRNWRTGLTELQKEVDTRDRLHCCFLDDKHIIFTLSISISHHPDDFLATSFRVLPFRHCEGSTTGTVRDAAVHFILPAFMHSKKFFAIAITELSSRRTGPMHPAHFYSNPDDRLFSSSIFKGSNADRHFKDHYILDIPSQTFSSYMRDHPTTGDSIVPWDAWGPHGTRVTRKDGHSTLTDDRVLGSSLCGMRRCDYTWSREGIILTVLDYHPRRVARALARKRDGDGTVIERGAHIGEQYAGGDQLSTTLPCLVTETTLPDTFANKHGEIVLCEDGFVFVEMDTQSLPHWAAAQQLVSDVWAYTI
ncbi:hypothetical protein BV25DRAFT_1832032 [Artomyces pyxidatus]|uniref:Uncharacterized protein n=1 Tax=Artomyces pyxidatus TaxID=48021 RepID=A0ACB8SK23_9AGAM|nr:hypothetical protein BV25DRAFT_1832032 [Artomyces pyxidatus]